MIKPLIKIRKLIWLPIKFFFIKKKIINDINPRTVQEVYERIYVERNNLLAAERNEILDQSEIDKYNTILNTLEWLLNKAE